MSGPSVLTHAVIENATDVNVAAHPIIVEDTLMRRVVPAARTEHCAVVFDSTHAVAGVEPSRVLRTVIDGLGGDVNYEAYFACSALHIRISDNSPLVVSVRVINSRGHGVDVDTGGLAQTAVESSYQLRDFRQRVLGPQGVLGGARLLAPAGSVVQHFRKHIPRCLSGGSKQMDVRGNWWGDPAGPQGPKGDGVIGNLDAGSPLAAPVDLGIDRAPAVRRGARDFIRPQ